ncbi:hypothetical protein ACIA8O_37355 [Kitasatospora sp. NPDC051853]|uniref:hypothetical protein n=1 Tax=Kitasatospora sp. NPDC051853 TaxID=3364058 RepID=UPI0037883DEB
MPDAVWVLNPMYEREHGPAGLSQHEPRQGRLADGSTQPATFTGADAATGVAPADGPVRTGHLGEGRRRLRWAELAQRVGDPVVPDGLLPSSRCFPSARKDTGWPPGIFLPTEGSLDRDTWNRLISVLTEHSTAGPDTPCLAYYNPLMLVPTDFENLHVRAGRLGSAEALYDNPEAGCSPSNLWTEDHSWVLCTDYDLWATKVAGPPALIEALLNDAEIEAVRLSWAS